MAQHSLSMACWDYDRTRPLIDGRVKPEGIDLRVQVMRPRQAFERMLATGEFDVCEMSFSNYVTLRAQPDTPLVALPVMLSKMFRHDRAGLRARTFTARFRHPRARSPLVRRRHRPWRRRRAARTYAR